MALKKKKSEDERTENLKQLEAIQVATLLVQL